MGTGVKQRLQTGISLCQAYAYVVIASAYLIWGTNYFRSQFNLKLSINPVDLVLGSTNLAAIVTIGLVIVLFRARKILAKKQLSIKAALTQAIKPQLTVEMGIRILLVVVSLAVTLVVYVTQKQRIPLLQQGLLDPELQRLDTWLHLGYAPFPSWVQAAPGRFMAQFTDAMYLAWYTLKAPVFAFFVFGSRRRCAHFFSAYVLMWILCGQMATHMPSLGPCFTEPQVAQLHGTYASRLQSYLWTNYQSLLTEPDTYVRSTYEGIAAFPSLHVGLVALICCFLWRRRILFVIGMAYWGVIQWGSVYLGWHYAVDGYWSSLLAIVLYFITKWLVSEKDLEKLGSAP